MISQQEEEQKARYAMNQPDPFDEIIAELNDEWDRVERDRRGRHILWLVLTGLALLGLPVAVAVESVLLGIVMFSVALFSLRRFLRALEMRPHPTRLRG
jgi:hypothetical protein